MDSNLDKTELDAFIAEHVSQNRLTSFEKMREKCKRILPTDVAIEDFNPAYINTNSFRHSKEIFRMILEYQQEWPNLNFTRECCDCYNCTNTK